MAFNIGLQEYDEAGELTWKTQKEHKIRHAGKKDSSDQRSSLQAEEGSNPATVNSQSVGSNSAA